MVEDDIARLLDEFREAAVSYGAAIAEGHVRVTNRCSERLQRVDRELAKRGREAALLDLLYDESEWVQVCAAVGLLILECAEETAMQTLRHIATEGESLASLDAEMAILGWESGAFQSYEGLMAGKSPPKKAAPTSMQELDRREAVEKIERPWPRSGRSPGPSRSRTSSSSKPWRTASSRWTE